MLYELLYPLRLEADWLSWLNVLRYVPFRVIAAMMTSMCIGFALSPWFIRRLQTRQIGQAIRDDGPESHLSKAGTPTMGGSLILFSLVVSTVLWADLHNHFIWLTLALTVGYGLIGFIDDYLKIKYGSSRGMPGKFKLLFQIALAGVVFLYLFMDSESGLPVDWMLIRHRLAFPFVAFAKYPISIPPLVYVAFATFVVVAMSNAVNLTDGLDGLAIGPVMVNAFTYLFLAYMAGLSFFGINIAVYLDIAPIGMAKELTIFCGAIIGSGVGFLWYNTYPAQVFMGDVGSLALGGALGMLAVLTKNEFLSVILGGIFVLEALSVVTQVVSFKLTGRRIFKMAPIHHHFEIKGWAEPKIIVRFWIISIMLALIALGSLKLR
ncbi:MAG: phospho-N-acetylmuramoyl-pentapeptide-transferase [Deltaproteobacteria bacterium]|nr:phospho-N-acetylmuramoyl-pentapeptide-transferase [Deltaproteobacteria bacterium]